MKTGSSSDDDAPLSTLIKDGKEKKTTPKNSGSDSKNKRVKSEVKYIDESSSDDDKPIKKAAAKSSSASKVKKEKAKEKVKAKDDDEEDDGDDDGDDDEEEEEEDSDDEPIAKKRKAPATKKKEPAKKRVKTDSKEKKDRKGAGKAVKKEGETKQPRNLKELTDLELIDRAMAAYKWWEHDEHKKGINWEQLEHNGVYFPPKYVPHGVKVKYDGVPVDLTPEQEEVATYYAAVAPDGPQLSNPKTAEVFNKNFFMDFKARLGPNHIIKDFSKLDFNDIRLDIAARRDVKKNRSKEDKEEEKKEKQKVLAKFGYLMVDGHVEKIGNMTLEPSSLFRGRGEHPKMGCLKTTLVPEQLLLNTGEDAIVPVCPIPGHAWGAVQHDKGVKWLATWNENVMGGIKYTMLNASSSFKGKSDRDKYNKAAELNKHIDKIRRDYRKNLTSTNLEEQQLGTAMWLIDVLALRAGNEKGEEEADTVGCCSLRVEHVSFADPLLLTLDFLGKDSMRFFQTIDFGKENKFSTPETMKIVFENMKKFASKKKPTEELFDRLTTSALNKHLGSLMPGLSAKVFRTYNASKTMQDELPHSIDHDTLPDEQLRVYNGANRNVAILCNHQRTVPKGFAANFEKMEEKEKLLKKQHKEMQEMRSGKDKSVRVKSEYDEDKLDAEKLKKLKEEESHLFSKTPSKDQLDSKIADWKMKLEKHQVAMKNKDENKEVSLGTSKTNYIDPRVTVAWCKRNEVPIEKCFTSQLKSKYRWAMSVGPDWKFC